MLRTYVRVLDGKRHETDRRLSREHLQRLPQLLLDLRVEERSGLVELRRSVTDGDLGLDHARACGCKHLAELRLRPDRAEGTRAGADDERGLAAQDARGERPRQPVDRVLQLA